MSNIWQRLRAAVWPPAPMAATGYRAAVSDGRSGRPAYASGMGALTTLPREQSLELLDQYVKRIPLMMRTVQILAGFCGCPEFKGPTDAISEELELWASTVRYGRVGQGLGPFIRDHLGQTLIFGFGVGEAEVNMVRRDVSALWSYRSRGCGFKSTPDGELEILQQQAGKGLVTLNPETTILSVNNPQGCDPNGQSLFLACPTFAQSWLDITEAFQSTWRRCGTPIFHVNWEPPAEFKDPNGEIGQRVLTAMEESWNSGMKSMVVDGKPQDFFTTGKVSVLTVGADGQVIAVDVSKRAMVEELVVATGIPAWMFGYSWSSTERLSTQQADTLLTWIDCMRAQVTPGLLKLVNLRQRLMGIRGVVEIEWPDVSLQDLVETANAELATARALKEREAVAEKLWRNGVYDQLRYAEAVTGEAMVVNAMGDPYTAPSPMGGTDPAGGVTDPANDQSGQNRYDLKALIGIEEHAAYPGWGCRGH